MATPFRMHGKDVTDSGLYPWILGSITRALFFYGEAGASGANKGAVAISSYYSLFHLGLFLMFGCPKHLSENERKRINDGMADGAADPNPNINHTSLLAFLSRCTASQGLAPIMVSAIKRAKDARETINYGPRVRFHANGDLTFENCDIQPGTVDVIRAEIPSVLEAAVDGACRNGEDGGVWVGTSLGQAEAFFAGPRRLYGGWCSEETARVSEQTRRRLLEIANGIVFPLSGGEV